MKWHWYAATRNMRNESSSGWEDHKVWISKEERTEEQEDGDGQAQWTVWRVEHEEESFDMTTWAWLCLPVGRGLEWGCACLRRRCHPSGEHVSAKLQINKRQRQLEQQSSNRRVYSVSLPMKAEEEIKLGGWHRHSAELGDFQKRFHGRGHFPAFALAMSTPLGLSDYNIKSNFVGNSEFRAWFGVLNPAVSASKRRGVYVYDLDQLQFLLCVDTVASIKSLQCHNKITRLVVYVACECFWWLNGRVGQLKTTNIFLLVSGFANGGTYQRVWTSCVGWGRKT